MSIQYKSVAKGQPGVVGGGQAKYYAQIVRGREVKLREFITEIADSNTLNTADVMAVLESFLQLSGKFLSQGRKIDFGQLGSFSPSVLSTGADTPEAVSKSNIKRLKVNFRPSQLLQQKLSTVTYEKVANGTASQNPDVSDTPAAA